MQKPHVVEWAGRVQVVGGNRGAVEYVAWSAPGLFGLRDLTKRVFDEFGVTITPNNTYNVVVDLLNRNRIKKISRGVYVHVDKAFMYD